MTFLYTSSVFVGELKAAVLSKTKPNKPEKQAEGLELSPCREVKLRAPAPASALCLCLSAREPNLSAELGGPVSAVNPNGPGSFPAPERLVSKSRSEQLWYFLTSAALKKSLGVF